MIGKVFSFIGGLFAGLFLGITMGDLIIIKVMEIISKLII